MIPASVDSMNWLLNALRKTGLLRGALEALRRMGLLRATFRAYEKAIALQGRRSNRDPGQEQAGGLPLPPAEMMVLVAGSADTEWFLQFGASMLQIVVDALKKQDVRAERLSAVLEFGCGCGRVLRHWHAIKGPRIYGVDYNRRLVEWCQENLTFASCAVNNLSPPLPYEDGMFDCVYAISVFTHMSPQLQPLWVQELKRVMRPGGHLILTTHGATYRDRLTAREREAFLAGQLVVRYEEASGMNLCTAYHPESYVRGGLSAGFEVRDFIPAATQGVLYQDFYLLKKDK
jgi:SAM-dependent methyltransferase